MLAPWDLYAAQPDGREQQLLLRGVQFPGPARWSPDGKYLAFAGVYDNLEGIWVLDREKNKLSRILVSGANFDWSPNSQAIIILEPTTQEDDDAIARPAILSLPFESE
jgi:Tol biopolymer transport system component